MFIKIWIIILVAFLWLSHVVCLSVLLSWKSASQALGDVRKMQKLKYLSSYDFIQMLSVTSVDAFRFLSATQWDCRVSERHLPMAEWKKVADDSFRYPLSTKRPAVFKLILLCLHTWMCVLVVIIFVTWHRRCLWSHVGSVKLTTCWGTHSHIQQCILITTACMHSAMT